MIHLRPYQTKAIDEMRSLMKQGCKSILYQGATGSGKTALTAHMLHTAASKGLRSLFVVHRRELLRQSAEAFNNEGLKHGIIAAGFLEDKRHLVQIASVQTLARRALRYAQPRLVVWDEVHHIAARSWKELFGSFRDSYHIGLSATPARLDGQGLGAFFKELLCGPSVKELTAQGYLSPYRLYAPVTVSVEGVHTRMGDYAQNELSRVMDKPSITGDAVTHYKKYAMGKRAIVFAVSIQHSQHIVEKFRAEGINAEHVDGETDPDVRDRAIENFKAGNIQVLSNVELFGEGFNVPAMEVAILMRPTQSTSLYLQQVGRALRPFEGKTTAIILDHVGNCLRHGMPDEDRTWTLEGHDRRAKQSVESVSVKICPSCFAAQEAGRPSCKFCGFVYEKSPRKVAEKEGELEEVTQIKREARREQGMAQSMEDLYRIGVARGYKNARAWSYFVFKARMAKKLRGGLSAK